MTITVHPFYESSTGSYSYVVANAGSGCCAIIDAALGVSECDGGAARFDTHTADLMWDWIHAHGFTLRYLLETHVHADRPTASGYLKSRAMCAQTVIGAGTPRLMSGGARTACAPGYDRLVNDGDKLCLDRACLRVISTPGHTPGCVSYQCDNFVFVGDTLFMPDAGTARCDFPGGCATTLYGSIQKLLALPDETRLFMCHDYQPDGRRPRFVTTVAEQRAGNVHVGEQVSGKQFVAKRTARDATLAEPRWQTLSIPANLACADLTALAGNAAFAGLHG